MTRNCKIIILVLISALCLSPLHNRVLGQDRMAGNDSLSFEILLTDRMFSDFKPGGRFISSIDITAERFILLSVPDQYYVLGWGGIVPLGNKMNREIQSFAYTPDGLLLTVSGNDLCNFDGNGNLSSMVRLPRKGMGISAGQEVIYLFDRNPGQKPYPLYVYTREGRYLKLIESPDPITAVAETGDAVLFAAGSKLYSINPGAKEVRLLFEEGNGGKILSVTTDTGNDITYFSTADRILAIRGLDLATVSEKSGGILRYFNGLIVLNPETKLVIRILGLEDELKVKQTSQATQITQAAPDNRMASVNSAQGNVVTQETGTMQNAVVTPTTTGVKSGDIGTIKVLTNETVVALVQNELGDNIIINLIRRAKTDFSLTTDDVIELSGKGVSPAVIREMRQAMNRQALEIQNR